MKNKKIFSGVLITTIVATALLMTASSKSELLSKNTTLETSALTSPVRMLFPLYIYPGTNGSAWQKVVDANTYRNIDAIVNPSNGAGQSKDINYTNGINKLRASGVGIYGYVYSSYGDRDIALVKADIDRWIEWYSPLVGIFVDEAEYRDYQNDTSYYAEIYNYISSKGLRVINNPGTGTTETYAGLADTTCIFESAVTKALVLPLWTWNYPSSKFCYLAHSASLEQMKSAVITAKNNNVGYIYVTNATTNYWSSIPPYLAEEAALLADAQLPQTMVSATNTQTPVVIPSVTKTTTPQPSTVTITLSPKPSALPTITPSKTPTTTPTSTLTQQMWTCEITANQILCKKYP